MQLRRVRFTVRTMMVAAALAVFLLALAAGVVWSLSPEQVRLRSVINGYNAKAEHHAVLERELSRLSEFADRSHAIVNRGGRPIHVPIGQRPELIPKYLELAKYHGALRQKYESAAWHPSLPVEPDPPPPEP
jgi:hypothetical protein